MKTLKIICTLSFLCILLRTQSQIINQNPDPNGTPWWTNDAIVSDPSLNPHTYQFSVTPASLALTLPEFVHNETKDYFPDIINQKGGSCVQVAEIWYTFDYEINRKYGRTAGNGINDFTNLYNYLFTYNFLNGASSSSSTPFQSGFNLIMQNGCPVWDIFDDPALYESDWFKYWMTGYDKYKSGMQNTISGIPLFEFSLVPDLGLNYLKNWVAYHGNASDDGGWFGSNWRLYNRMGR